MTVGDKIKKIRTFRGMTQKELGLAIGFEEKGADNRIAQYETNYRVPKRELLDKMAEALRVDRQNFYTIAPGSAEDFMRTFFWLDEDSPGAIRLFQLVRNPGRAGAADDTAVRYNDSDDWPAHPPVGMYFQYGLVDEFMREWLFRQQSGLLSIHRLWTLPASHLRADCQWCRAGNMSPAGMNRQTASLLILLEKRSLRQAPSLLSGIRPVPIQGTAMQ